MSDDTGLTLCLKFPLTDPCITSFFDSNTSAAAMALNDYFGNPPHSLSLQQWLRHHYSLFTVSYRTFLGNGTSKGLQFLIDRELHTLPEIFYHYAKKNEFDVINTEFRKFAFM